MTRRELQGKGAEALGDAESRAWERRSITRILGFEDAFQRKRWELNWARARVHRSSVRPAEIPGGRA